MNFSQVANSLADSLRTSFVGAASSATVLLLKKSASGLTQLAVLDQGFILLEKKNEAGQAESWLQISSDQNLVELFETASCLVFTNYNSSIDNLIFDIDSAFHTPTSFAYYQRKIKPTMVKYGV